jgi:hypothetical protein
MLEEIRTELYIVHSSPACLTATRAAQPSEVRADTDCRLLKAGVAEWIEARAYTGLPRTESVVVYGVP